MKRKLLLADDSVTIQRVIELTFADEDVEVVAVGDGKKAIASIEQDRPDIVLADVGMPERDGYEVAAFIKGNPHLAAIPVLLLTGAFEPIDETRARAVGCDGVLVKPFEPQMVINRVKDLLAGRRPAGLWTASPTAQGPTRHSPVPERDHGVRTATVPPAPPGSGASLEDYFDRLDAAFANLEASPHPDATHAHTQSPAVEAAVPPEATRVAVPVQPAQPWRDDAAASASGLLNRSSGLPADVLDGWDPDLTGDPKKADPVVTAPSSTPAAPPEVRVQEPPSPPALVSARASSPVQTPMPSPSPPPTPAPSLTPTPAPSPAPTPSQAAPSSPAPTIPPHAAPAASPMPPASSVPPAPPVALPIVPSVVSPPHEASAAAAASLVPSLAEAFSALLSAEQSRAISPSAVSGPGLSNAALEDIVRRVVARMSDEAIRDTVVDIAERLVREEIERIKGEARK
jgi:CheY-like chemotaxis protein